MKFWGYAGEVAERFDKHLDRVIPDDHGSGMGSYIKQLVSGGKRIRPVLTTLSYQAVGGNMEDAVPLAMVMEFTHNATLSNDFIAFIQVFNHLLVLLGFLLLRANQQKIENHKQDD